MAELRADKAEADEIEDQLADKKLRQAQEQIQRHSEQGRESVGNHEIGL